MDRRHRLHLGGILLPYLKAGLVAGRLQQMHRGRFPSVRLAGFARFVEAADRQNVLSTAPAFNMHFFGFALDTGYPDAADPAGHSGEILGAHGARQADCLKVKTAAI